MKKVGILTYHFALNYGAALQCYALKKSVELLNTECFVIDSLTDQQKRNNSLSHKRYGIKNLIMQIGLLPFYSARKRKQDKFISFSNNYFSLTSRCKNSYELINVVLDYKLDTVICGSDQVWNTKIDDFTELFFLPFKANIRKLGYGISIGGCTYNELKNYRNEINNFDSIGVRETKAASVLNNLSSIPITKVIDPTLLLKKEDWDKMAKNSKISIKEPYIICYFLHKDYFSKEYDLVKKIAKVKKLKVFYINQRYSIRSFYSNTLHDVGPNDFISLIKNAELVCTDSFHGTLFSIIYHKAFYSFIPSQNIKDTRQQDVLDCLGLSSRCVYLDHIKLCDEDINYKKIEDKISILRHQSLDFLRMNM